MADDLAKKAPLKGGNEIGVTGLKVFSGVTQEEFQIELRGERGVKTLKRMATSDPVIKAVLRAITLVLRGVKWRVEPIDESKAAGDEAAFVESLMEDMSHTWEDFISEVLSMLIYGWSYHEVVLKSRVGPLEADASKRSKYTDGRIGIRKIAPRSQDSLLKWEMQEDGGIDGMWQQPITGGQFFIPIEKALLFRTTSYKNSPEGESIIRAAYESWYHATNIRNFESVGIERELAGLPVISIPAQYLSADATPTEVQMRNQYEKMARDVKFNEQGGLVIPSNVYTDSEGKLVSGAPLVKIELLSSSGQRKIDTTAVISRHQRDMARSVLAEFVMLGGDGKGSYALSKDKTDFFLQACESLINQIAAPINRFLLPRIWDYNGLDRALLPYVRSEPIAAKDLASLGAYIQALAAAGAPLFPDQTLDEYLREVADLPPPAPDAAEQQKKQIDEANAPPKPGAEPNPKDPNKPAGADNGDGGTQKRARPRFAPIKPKAMADVVEKFNTNHDKETGQFSTGDGGEYQVFHRTVGREENHKYTVTTRDNKLVAELRVNNGDNFVDDVTVFPDYRRKGVATALYANVEQHLGHELKPSPVWQSEDGKAFWSSRKKSVKKFNPNHDDKGLFATSDGGGSGGEATALYDAAIKSEGEIAHDQLVAQLSPAEQAKIADARERMTKEVTTNSPVDKGGFLQADGTYTPERAALHRQIVDRIMTPDAIRAALPQHGEKPVMNVLGGRGGSGKSFITSPTGPVDRNKTLMVDADAIKAMLPEYKGFNANTVHDESSHITDMIDQRAIGLGINVTHDATLKNDVAVTQRMRMYKGAGYDVNGYYVFASPRTAATRAIGRFIRGGDKGRFVPPEVILGNKSNEKNFDALKPQFKEWQIYDNNGKTPVLVAQGGKS